MATLFFFGCMGGSFSADTVLVRGQMLEGPQSYVVVLKSITRIRGGVLCVFGFSLACKVKSDAASLVTIYAKGLPDVISF